MVNRRRAQTSSRTTGIHLHTFLPPTAKRERERERERESWSIHRYIDDQGKRVLKHQSRHSNSTYPMLKISTYRAPASLLGSAISDRISGEADGGGDGGIGGDGEIGGEGGRGGEMSKHTVTSCSAQGRRELSKDVPRLDRFGYSDACPLLLLNKTIIPVIQQHRGQLCLLPSHRGDQLTVQQSPKFVHAVLHWQGAPGVKTPHRSPLLVAHSVVLRNKNGIQSHDHDRALYMVLIPRVRA